MAKKNWIYIKRGLSEDPKHREQMGNRIWLFMHMIDRADWETGIVAGWVDRDEAEDMGIPWRTLQFQRRELEEAGYITCIQKFQHQDIIIHNWSNPKDYGGKVVNVRGQMDEDQDDADHGAQNCALNGANHGAKHGAQNCAPDGAKHGAKHPRSKLRTPSIPSIDHGSMDGWMDGDLICKFLKGLPGYNAENLATDRATITQTYDTESLQHLWEDCQADARDNPIGLFLYRARQGLQSPRYVELCQRRKDEAALRDLAALNTKQTSSRLPAPSASQNNATPAFTVDPSVSQPVPGASTPMTPLQVWQAAQGELQLQMTRATYDTWVKPASVVKVNGTWQIAVPTQYAKEWWDTRLLTTVKRVLHGIVGQPCEPEFVIYQRGEA